MGIGASRQGIGTPTFLIEEDNASGFQAGAY